MARGLMTALQAALAGVSGGAAGYARYQELERQRLREEEERKRREAMDLITFGERAIESGPLATRAPMGAPRAEAPRTAVPPSAVPLPTGPMDFGGAMRQLEREEATPSGTTPLRIGDITLNIPIGQRARDIKQSEALLAERSALDAAMREAEATGTVRARQEREAFDVSNRRQFEVYRQQYQGRGEYNPNLDYASLNSAKEAQLGRVSAQQIARTRADATASGAAGAAGGRGPLPSVQDAIDYVNKLTADDVKKLSGWGVANAIAAPTTMASGAQGFLGAALGPLVSGAQYAAASEADRQYAEYASMVARQVARLNEKGVLSNQDVKDYKDQTGFVAGETESGKARKIARLKQWAEWVRGTETGTDDVDTAGALRRLPGESPQAYLVRTANLRRQ